MIENFKSRMLSLLRDRFYAAVSVTVLIILMLSLFSRR